MSAARLVVKGADDLERAFKQVRKETLKELRPALRKAAEPVRAEAARRFAPINPESAEGYKVRVRIRGVAVEQSRRRTTGTRADFGRLQMREALIPALDAKQQFVLDTVEEMVDDVGRRAGF